MIFSEKAFLGAFVLSIKTILGKKFWENFLQKQRPRINHIKPIKILNFLIRLSDNIIFAGLPFSYLKKSIWAPNCPLHCSLTAKQHPGTLVPGLLFREGIGAAGQHLPRCFPSARLRSVWANINKQWELPRSTALVFCMKFSSPSVLCFLWW